MPDIFDQIHASTQTAPGGDVFDQIHEQGAQEEYNAEAHPQGPKASPQEAAFNRSLSQPGIQAENQRQNALSSARQRQADLDAQGPVQNAWNAFKQGTSNLAIKGVAQLANALPGQSLNPQQMTNVMQRIEAGTQEAAPNDPERLSGKIGSTAAQVAPMLLAPEAAPEVMLAQGTLGRQEDIDARRAVGQTITPQQAALSQVLGGAMDFGMGKLAPGGVANKALMGELPAVANPILNRGVSGIMQGAVAAPEMGLFQAGQNVIAQKTGIDPNRQLSEGVPEASATGLALGGAGGLAHGNARPEAAEQTPYDWQADRRPAPAPEVPQGEDAGYGARLAEGQNALADLRRQHAEAVSAQTKGAAVEPPDFSQAEFQPGAEESPEVSSKLEGFDRNIPDRRTNRAPVDADAERRFEDLTKQATFQPPEEVNPRIQTPKEGSLEHDRARIADLERRLNEVDRTPKDTGPAAEKPAEPDFTNAAFSPASETHPETSAKLEGFTPVERRVNEVPVDKEAERRFEELTKQATFATPEETHPNFFQKKAGEHAASEEYGKPKTSGPVASEPIRDLASSYQRKAGLPEATDRSYAKVNPERAKQIAADYDVMKHDPSDPRVKASYDAFKAETLAQYNHLKDAGYSFTPKDDAPDSVLSSVLKDMHDNKHLDVYTGVDIPEDHPMAERLPANADKDGLGTYNTMFRAVHDVFGHGKEGYDFGHRGEENAWRQHVQMYSPEARGAMTSETKGQTDWVLAGPHAEHNAAQPAGSSNIKYAEQKAGLLPEEHTQVEAPNLFQRLAKEEAGGVKIEPFMRRDVVPAATKIVEGAKALAKSLDRHLDLGFSKTAEGKKTGLSLAKTIGSEIQAGHAFEDAIVKTGAREAAPKFSEDEPSALAHWDYLDDGGQATNPKEQAALDLIQAKRQENSARAAKLGVRLADVDGEGLSRIFTFPEGKTGSRSLAGPENYRKSQTYEKPSDAYNAATSAGGKPAYDNIYDMQMARQYEVGRSLSARENLRAADVGGTIRWFPDGTKPDEGFETKIQDKAGTEIRKMALPSWMVGRFSKMEGFEAANYLKENADKLVDVRPGEQPPQGYSFTPKEVRGSYHAPEDTARTFNDMLGKAKGDPIESLPGKIARATIMQRYGLSVVHAFNGLKAYLNQQTGTALSALTGKGNADVQQGLQSVTNATVYGGWKRGLELQQEIEKPGTHPGLAEVAKRVIESNPETKFRSVLDRPKLADAVEEFKAGNWQGGTARLIKAAVDLVPDLIYHGVLDKLDLSVRRDLAERQIRQGTIAEAGAADLSRAGDTISRALGRHANSPAFKNSVVTTVGKILAPAFQYKVGLLRNVGEALRNNPHAQAQLTGAIVNTALMGAATMATMTYANTGKVQLPEDVRDYWNPKTGNQDANGHDERITLPGYEAFLMRSLGGGGVHGLKDEAIGSLNPAIVGTKEAVENKDFYGNQVRPDEGSTAGNVGRTLLHVAKGAAPISVMQGMNSGQAPEGDERSWGRKLAQGLVGGTTSHPVTSDAEQTAYDILNKNQQGGRNLTEQEIHDNSKKWVKMIKDGQEDAAMEEMNKNPAMSESRAQSVFRRAAGEKGLAGLVADTQFKPADLLNIWNKGTPGEKAKMKDTLLGRLGRANPTSEAEGQEWLKLQEAVE